MQTLFDAMGDATPEKSSADKKPKKQNRAVASKKSVSSAIASESESLIAPEAAGETREPLSVSSFIVRLNQALGNLNARVTGEVTSAKRGPTGHWYFTLKDPDEGSLLNCVIWRSNYTLSGVALEDGLAVVVSGVPDFYGPSGRLSFKADTIELVGEGALRAAYLKLKENLTREGVFSNERKRPLPAFPKRIGVITSTKSGTVIHDFTNNLGRHGFNITVCDSRVEGADAVRDLIAALAALARSQLDVLVIMRGGGSFESLAPFDNEAVVRAVVSFPVPVIAGIGHHEDVTLAALAADHGVSTPTAAANLLNKTWDEARHARALAGERVFSGFEKVLFRAEHSRTRSERTIGAAFVFIGSRYAALSARIRSATTRIADHLLFSRKRMYENRNSIVGAFSRRVDEIRRAQAETKRFLIARFVQTQKHTRTHMDTLERAVAYNDPKRTLQLGYSIVAHGGKIVRSVNDVTNNAILTVQVRDGEFDTTVQRIKKAP